MKKIKCLPSGVNFSKRVDIERSGPPKKYRDDKDSIDFENFHNPLCSYRRRNIRETTQKFDEEITGQILR